MQICAEMEIAEASCR